MSRTEAAAEKSETDRIWNKRTFYKKFTKKKFQCVEPPIREQWDSSSERGGSTTFMDQFALIDAIHAMSVQKPTIWIEKQAHRENHGAAKKRWPEKHIQGICSIGGTKFELNWRKRYHVLDFKSSIVYWILFVSCSDFPKPHFVFIMRL